MTPDAVFTAFSQTAASWINAGARGVEALPVSYAFGAGMLASVNPCGFVMLPAFAAFFVSTEAGDGRLPSRIAVALRLGLLVTLAFVATFTLAGAVVWVGGRAFMSWAGWAGLAVGVALTAFGAAQLVLRRSLFARATAGLRVQRAGGTRGALTFGLGYAICSLGCTLPAFLVVAGSVFLGSTDYLQSLSRFVEYSLGMGAVLTVVAVAVTLARAQATRIILRATPVMEAGANVMLVLAGLYVIWYWTNFDVLL